MLAAVSAVTAATIAASALWHGQVPEWLLATPVLLGISWAYLLLASRGDVTVLRVFVTLMLGIAVGAAVSLVESLLFYRFSGLWCSPGLTTTDVGTRVILEAAIVRALPHWAAAALTAGLLVRANSRTVQIACGIVIGAAAGLIQVIVMDPAGWHPIALDALAGHAAAYGILLPLLAWLGDLHAPLADRAPRRALPLIAWAWGLPPFAMLIGGIVAADNWLGLTPQAALTPVLLALELLREFGAGRPEPNVVQHVAVSAIILALVIGLLPSRRWAWLPWAICWLHDLAYLIVVVWATGMLLSNVQATSDGVAGGPSSLNTHPFYAILMGLGYVLALRVWCLTRRGVRPTW